MPQAILNIAGGGGSGGIEYSNIVYNEDDTVTLTDTDGNEHTIVCEYEGDKLIGATYDDENIDLIYSGDNLVGIDGLTIDLSGLFPSPRLEITYSTAGDIMFAGYFDSTDRTAIKTNDGLAVVGYCTRYADRTDKTTYYFACYVGEASESVHATNIKNEEIHTIEYEGKTYYYSCTSTINRNVDTQKAWLIGTYEDGYVDGSGFICNELAVRRLLDYYYRKI
jgi:hypothetical protein